MHRILVFIRYLVMPRRASSPTIHCSCGALVDRTDEALEEHIEVCPVQVAVRAAFAARYDELLRLFTIAAETYTANGDTAAFERLLNAVDGVR